MYIPKCFHKQVRKECLIKKLKEMYKKDNKETQAEQLPQDAVMQSVLKNQVRIGNLVDFNGKVETVYAIRNSGVDFYRGKTKKSVIMQSYVWEAIKPIPLTEEWLLKFGFTEPYKKGYFVLELEDDSYLFFNNHARGYAIKPTEEDGKTLYTYTPLTYVHQLQNLYFALTGSELTVA